MASFPAELIRYRSRPSLTSNVPVSKSESRSLITHVRALNSQRWELVLDFMALPKDVDAVNAFIFGLNGQLNSFTWTIDSWGISQATNKTVMADAARGTNSVQLFSVDSVKVGEFLNFSNHDKAYMVTGINLNTITVFPSLRMLIPQNTTAVFNNPTMLLELKYNAQTFEAASVRHPVEYSLAVNEKI